eukprot:scaffold8760_cov116-Isochrysis_galbana.AAC.4
MLNADACAQLVVVFYSVFSRAQIRTKIRRASASCCVCPCAQRARASRLRRLKQLGALLGLGASISWARCASCRSTAAILNTS